MENIFSGLNMQDMLDKTTSFISGLSPYITLIIGILLAFLVIKIIISILTGKDYSENFDEEEDY